jgi:molybdate transport system permease protein
MLGFARSLGEFGATITFASNIAGETRTLPLAIYTGLQLPGGEALVTRLSIVSVILSVAALVISELLVRRSGGSRAHVL